MARTEEARRGRHETRDIDVALIAKLLALGVVVTAVVLVAVFWLFGSIRDREEAADPVLSPYAANPSPFVGPRLQPDPPADLRAIRAHEEQILDSYGWTDRERGLVRIPIERAMELLLERGLPVATGPATEEPGVDAPR